MTRVLAIACLTAALTAGVLAQHAGDQDRRADVLRELSKMSAEIGARVALETRVTRGQPYTADAVTEIIQPLADGNRIVRRTTVRQARDSEGRTRRETIGGGAGDPPQSIVISDPVAGVSYILDPAAKTAFKGAPVFARMPGGGFTAAGAGGRGGSVTITRAPSGAKPDAEAVATVTINEAPNTATAVYVPAERARLSQGDSVKESLGDQMIEGVMAAGTRTTTTIPAGSIGNEQPITIVSEQWFSNELEVLVLTRHADPRSGETTYRLTNLVRSEPDRSLFQPPADYAVMESPRKPMVWQQQQQ